MDRVKQITNIQPSTKKEAINMFLSGNINIGGNTPCLSADKFDVVADEILRYLEIRKLQDRLNCKKSFNRISAIIDFLEDYADIVDRTRDSDYYEVIVRIEEDELEISFEYDSDYKLWFFGWLRGSIMKTNNFSNRTELVMFQENNCFVCKHYNFEDIENTCSVEMKLSLGSELADEEFKSFFNNKKVASDSDCLKFEE